MRGRPVQPPVKRSWLTLLLYVGPAFGAAGAVLGLQAGAAVTAMFALLSRVAARDLPPASETLPLVNIALWTLAGAALGLWAAFHQGRDEEPARTPDLMTAPAPTSTGITGWRPQDQ
jgi:hypothetical protein